MLRMDLAAQSSAGRTLYDRLGYTYAGPYRNEPGGQIYDLLLLQIANEDAAR
ncbi:hypothetical protein [Streptomyces sp. NPDC050982]|uniref:hypothetical protein n=1 Tax=Streptomyces sp. NPDC050982 TaxID=3154746 RepID=UPI0033FA8085